MRGHVRSVEQQSLDELEARRLLYPPREPGRTAIVEVVPRATEPLEREAGQRIIGFHRRDEAS